MKQVLLSEIMEQVLSLAPEAVAMSQIDGNILISLNMKLDSDWDTLVPVITEGEDS